MFYANDALETFVDVGDKDTKGTAIFGSNGASGGTGVGGYLVDLVSAIATTGTDDRYRKSVMVWTSYDGGKRWKERKEAEGEIEIQRC